MFWTNPHQSRHKFHRQENVAGLQTPKGIGGRIVHGPPEILADSYNLDKDTRTPLPIGVIGLLSLIVGVAILELGNFTAAQFDRAPWLGWLTVALLAPACAAVLWSAVREWRGLAALKTADEVRVGLQSEDLKVARTQADNWLKAIDATPEVVSLVQSAKDAETLRSLLRTGPLAKLDQEVYASGRAAALRVLAATAVSPWPGLDGVIVIWQSLRLVRQVARLYGLRPGALGTLRLLRRATTDASTVAATDVAVAALTEAVLNSPLACARRASHRLGHSSPPHIATYFCHRAKLSADSMVQFTPRNLNVGLGSRCEELICHPRRQPWGGVGHAFMGPQSAPHCSEHYCGSKADWQ